MEQVKIKIGPIIFDRADYDAARTATLEAFGWRVLRFHNVYGPLGTYEGGREKAPAALCRKIRAAGLLDRRPGSYAVRIAATLAAFAGGWVVFGWLGNSWLQLITAGVLGLLQPVHRELRARLGDRAALHAHPVDRRLGVRDVPEIGQFGEMVQFLQAGIGSIPVKDASSAVPQTA